MIIRDDFSVEAPVEKVWNFVRDIPQMSSCIPGVLDVEQIEPDKYRGHINVRVGPITAVFGGIVRVIECTKPEKLVALAEAEDRSSASFVKVKFTGRLASTEAGTRVSYEVDLTLRGRLAQFGFTLIRGTAKKMTTEFARRIQEALRE